MGRRRPTSFNRRDLTLVAVLITASLQYFPSMYHLRLFSLPLSMAEGLTLSETSRELGYVVATTRGSRQVTLQRGRAEEELRVEDCSGIVFDVSGN
jgi:hypothetical protein